MSLVSGIRQYSKVVQLHISIYLFFFKFFPQLGYYRLLSRVFWAIYNRSLVVVNSKDSR